MKERWKKDRNGLVKGEDRKGQGNRGKRRKRRLDGGKRYSKQGTNREIMGEGKRERKTV